MYPIETLWYYYCLHDFLLREVNKSVGAIKQLLLFIF